MKKVIISLSIFVYIFSFAQIVFPAQTIKQNAEISKIETELYGFDYINDELINRITRLEKSIYGKVLSGDINNRIKKITTDIISENIGKEIEPTEDTFYQEEELADSSVNYPILDEIEKKIFNQTYKNRDFHTRIVTIERKLFNKIYDVEDYSTRMDRIKAEVLPEQLAREKVFGYDNSNSLTQNDLSGLNRNRFTGIYGQENYTRPYVNYGDYQGVTGAAPEIPDNINDQLAQLEYSTFGTEFSNEDTNTRIKRLNSVNKAKKSSSRYDSQKFNQRMSTVMEIGAMLLMILAMVL
ncbi:MAG: hypothetical protein E7Z92_02835 [Cyanobacteria bacterium SIG31]|nr:hypothetical protein [Cyanobacteria bacterium SIG31]